MREGRTPGAAFVLAALLLTPGAAAWTQLGGSAYRDGTAILPPGPLDVLASYRFLGEDEALGTGFAASLIPTPHGILGVLNNFGMAPGTCTSFSVQDPRTGGLVRQKDRPCVGQETLAAYDPVLDVVLSCMWNYPSAVLLEARDAQTGEVRWAIRGTSDLNIAPTPSTSNFNFNPDDDEDIWHCRGLAVDFATREVFAPFHAGVNPPRNRLAVIELDTGKVRWAMEIPASVFTTGFAPPSEPPADLDNGGDAGFTAEVVTLTDVGLLVVGDFRPGSEEGLVWLDRGGNITGATLSEGDARAYVARGSRPEHTPGASEWATASGALGAMAIGDRLLLVNPTARRPIADQRLDTIEPLDLVGLWAPLRWWEQTLLVPLAHSVTAYSSTDLTKTWTWMESLSWSVSDVLVVPPGDAYVLAAEGFGRDRPAAVFRLDLRTGTVVQRLPLPVKAAVFDQGIEVDGTRTGLLETANQKWYARLLPLPDDQGILVWDGPGNGVLLGTADPALLPTLEVGNGFPGPGERVTLTTRVVGGVLAGSVLVHWGEGPIESVPPDVPVSHQYSTPGIRNVRATAVYPDGRTATAEVLIEVGGTGPQDLTFMQTAFAPENQDATWGVIGLVLVVVGSLVTVGRTYRRRTVLERELKRLHQIQLRSTEDLVGAIRAVDAYRNDLQDAFTKGRFDDAQFSVLEIRVQRLARAFRHRLMSPFEARMSPGFHRLLETCLEDGVLTTAEAKRLLEGLKHEKRVSDGEKLEIARLLAV